MLGWHISVFVFSLLSLPLTCHKSMQCFCWYLHFVGNHNMVSGAPGEGCSLTQVRPGWFVNSSLQQWTIMDPDKG